MKKLKIKFRQNPFLGEPNPNVLCIGGCDLTVLETLDINPSSVKNRKIPIEVRDVFEGPIHRIPNTAKQV